MHRASVFYPAEALKQGVQGTVVVEMKLDSSGNVEVISGEPVLVQSALDAVRQ
jgi:TonB family protein